MEEQRAQHGVEVGDSYGIGTLVQTESFLGSGVLMACVQSV